MVVFLLEKLLPLFGKAFATKRSGSLSPRKTAQMTGAQNAPVALIISCCHLWMMHERFPPCDGLLLS